MNVRVRHLQPDHGHPDPLAGNGTLDLLRHVPGKQVDATQQPFVKVKEVVDLLFGDDEGVPLREGLDVEEGEELVVLGDAVARDVPGDDFAEDGGHLSRVRFRGPRTG